MEGRAEAEAEASGMGKRATTNPLMCASLTDLYQLSMCYAYWKNGRHEDHAVFDLFYRKNPFKGEYVIFAGLSEAMSLVSSFKFSQEDVDHLRESSLPGCDPQFYDWLLSVDCSQVRIVAQEEGSVVFPRVPLLVVEGPLAVVQLLETPLLNAVNFASLIATNASRFRRAAGQDKLLLEFGLRRAQGPDGGLSASRYSVVGGFDGTSNVLAGRLFGLPVKGTHAHSYVQSYSSLEEVRHQPAPPPAS
jgi:nicotinate phosphoribosyltransferase